jgi:hypothetical protein
VRCARRLRLPKAGIEKDIYTATLKDKLGASHFHEIGLQMAQFIWVRFLKNFGAAKFKVDDIWVTRYLPTGAAE